MSTAAASTGGSEWSTALNGGFRFGDGVTLFEPSVGLAYDHVSRDGYTESGADALNLTVSGGGLDSLRFSGGARAQTMVALGDGFVAWPELRARFVYETLNPVVTTTAVLQGIPDDPFEVMSVDTGHREVRLGAGVTVARVDNLAFFANYGAELRKNETVQSVVGGVRLTW
jgi:outer membrane autotransporter protein